MIGKRKDLTPSFVTPSFGKGVRWHDRCCDTFCPQSLCQHPCFPLDARSTFFLSNLEYLVEKGDLWLSGHSHHCYDEVICGTQVVANQRGYPSEGGTDYDPAFVVGM